MVKRLLLLNGLAVVGAVANHSTGWGFTAMFWWTDRYLPGPVPNFSQLNGPAYIGLRMLQQSIMFAIPAFLFVSGFFVAFAAGRNRDRVRFQTVSVRVKNLLIPYLFWSILIFIGRGLEGSLDTPAGYFEQLLFGRAAPPYYYVSLVTQLFLLAPLIVFALNRHLKATLILAGSIQLIAHLARYPEVLGIESPLARFIIEWSPGWFFPQTIFWFVFGIAAGLQRARFKEWLAQWRWALLVSAFVLLVMGVAEWEVLYHCSGRDWVPFETTLVDTLYAGAFILAAIAFEDVRLPMEGFLNDLGIKSFGIYLVHAPVLELVSRFSYHVSPWIFQYQLLFQSLLILVGLAVPLLLMAAVQRTPARPYYQYLFG